MARKNPPLSKKAFSMSFFVKFSNYKNSYKFIYKKIGQHQNPFP
jgi:hypothetical protein